MIVVVRFYDGLYLIGKEDSGDLKNPHQIIATPDGIQMVPFDEWILGKKIESINLDNSKVLYIEEPDKKLQEAYLQSVTGIETPKSEIIV